MELESSKVFHSSLTRAYGISENKLQPDSKVFHSNITRGIRKSDNNLYELIDVVPAAPKWEIKEKENSYCCFEPKSDKFYVPKKKSKICKVKTVGDIRSEFEKDIYSFLNLDLEKQQNFLLKKITVGSAKDENTKVLTKKILKSSNPISRSAWQMLMNINPDDQPNNIQFVLWNGKRIRVNGSKGAKNKFLCNHDLGTRKLITHNKPKLKNIALKKIGLLRNSLSVNFKPGPLTKKKSLDDSYQKYNVGCTELINLPKPCLEIKPTLGVPLEPTVVNFLNNYRNVEGNICQKWAEFSVSVVDSTKSTDTHSDNSFQPITFELNYKSNQSRILMRHDVDVKFNDNEIANHTNTASRCQDDTLVIQSVMNDILNSVDINIRQDEIYTGVDELRYVTPEDSLKHNGSSTAKEKPKRKLNELGRLDVTIIRIPEGSEDEKNEKCHKSFCSLGCICNSLRCDYKLKQHCGHVECMFECKCDFSKYKASNSFDGLLPGLINLNENINSKLAKEEKKFHQTVVVTREKSILLKSEKRNWKASKRYSDFFSNMNLRTDVKSESRLSIVDVKLNCDNVEPWCMVHCLYRCFCKGKFTDTSIPDKLKPIPDKLTSISDKHETTTNEVANIELDNVEFNTRSKTHSSEKSETKLKNISNTEEIFNEFCICARVKPYTGRKYKNLYYQTTNKKILEMERNDNNLHKKMISIINKNNENDPNAIENNSCLKAILTGTSATKKEEDHTNTGTTLSNSIKTAYIPASKKADESKNNESSESQPVIKHIVNCDPKCVSVKTKLMAWVEVGYKQYKQRFKQGNVKLFLERPKPGKFALYPSEFILDRYRERKNLFLVTKQQPMRIFMAVDIKHSFFDNCMNIDDIRFADLHKYPATIKNLLTNANNLQNTFFIMLGLSLCWEIVGTVTKVNENSEHNQVDTTSQENCESLISEHSDTEKNVLSFSRDSEIESTVTSPQGLSGEDTMDSDIVMFNCEDQQKNVNADADCEISKWFIMTIENDFSEIRFHERGFFVKYEAIIKAINVARMSNKAVRLSAPKCTDKNSATPFGIYAIPNTKEYCVYIGPYEKDESLGIEKVKSFKSAQKSKGVWITIKKLDNLKVIKSPLSFMPPDNLHPSKLVSLENETVVENLQTVKSLCSDPIAENRLLNIGKPIKINKSQGFYHLAFKNYKNIAANVSQPHNTNQASRYVTHTVTSSTVNQPLILPTFVSTSKSNAASTSKQFLINSENKKPVAEIAPQIKIVGVYSEADSGTRNIENSKRPEGGMFILKPEEINKKLMLNQNTQKHMLESRTINSTQTHLSSHTESDIMNEDIENFLATYEVCNPPNADVDMIAEEEINKKSAKYREVYIECLNVQNLGWIKGRRNSIGKLGFEFPGFKFTEFYTEEEAFSKINQVLSRKIYIPKTLQPKWHVVEMVQELKTKCTINPDTFGSDFVLTKGGPRHKRDLKSSKQNEIGVNDLINVLEQKSQILEKEGDQLLQQFKETGEALRSFYEISNNQQSLLNERLKNFINTDSPD